MLTLRWDLSCTHEPPEGYNLKNIGQTDVQAEGLSQVEQKPSYKSSKPVLLAQNSLKVTKSERSATVS